MESGRAGREDSEEEVEEREGTESESGEGEVSGVGVGSSLSQSVGVSQQPGPSGLHFSPHSLSSSLNLTSPPPAPGPSAPPQDVFAVSESQDVLGGRASQQLNFDPLPPIPPSLHQQVPPSSTREQQQSGPHTARSVLPHPQNAPPPSNQAVPQPQIAQQTPPPPARHVLPHTQIAQQSVPPSARHVLPQPPIAQQSVPPIARHVLPHPQIARQTSQAQPTQPQPHGSGAPVPSISDISSQSSDEDQRRRRRRGGGHQTLPSSLLQSRPAAHLPMQRLDQPTSESSGTEGMETAVVPDPETLRKQALERANNNPQTVPKAPSRLRKELKARERLTSASSSLPDSSQPSTSGTHHLTPPSLTPHPTPHHTHSSHPSPSSHAATSTTTSEDPSSSRDPTPLLEAESAYESACSLTSEPAGPSHHLNRGEVGASHHTPNRGEVGASPMPQVAEQGTSGRRQGPSTRRERGERRGLEDTQPLNCTPTREETSQGQRAQSSLRLSKGSSGNTWSSSSTSSSTVSSSSAGLQKIRSTSSLGASVEEAGVKEEGGGEGEEEGEGETQPLDQSTSPFAKDSQSPDMVSETSGRGEGDESVSVLETVPSTPVGSVEPSLPAAGSGGVAASQDLFQDNSPPPPGPTPSLDQDPSWYPSVASRQKEKEGGGEGGGTKRQISTESSSPGLSCPPPHKKRKLSGSGVSYLQRWEDSEGRGLSQGDRDTSSGSTSSSGNVSSSHSSSTPSSGGPLTSSSHHSSTPQSSDGKGGGGIGGSEGGRRSSGDGEQSSPDKSFQSPSLSRTEGEREEGGKTGQSDSVVEVIFENSEETNAQSNASSKNGYLSLSATPLLDPSPGREADRSSSTIPSSLPLSSLESCIATSTPQGEKQNMSLGNMSSLSVGYGGTEEERGEDKKEDVRLQVESETRGEGLGGDIEMREEDEDSDATTLGGSDTECGDERSNKPETTTSKGSITTAPMEEKDQGDDEHASTSSSSSWRLVCSATTNTYSETKSSASSQHPSSSETLHLCLSQDSLPDSELPLMIDLPPSQCSQCSDDEEGPTAITKLAKSCCENSDNRNIQTEKVGKSSQCHIIEMEKIEISSLSKEKNSGSGVEGEREGGGGRKGEGEELIREAWNLLQKERRSNTLLSPLKSQQTQDSDDVELVTGGGGEGEGGRCSEGFSLIITQSQTNEKTTPPPTDKPTAENVGENTAPQPVNSIPRPTISQDTQPMNTSRETSGGANDFRTSRVQDKARARPKPVYESIALSDSTGFLSTPLPQCSQSDQEKQPSHPSSSQPHSSQPHPSQPRPSHPHPSPPHPSQPHSSTHPPQVPSSSTGSQPHGNDISQASSSSAGTPFQFHIPQTGVLLQPHQYTSPPSLHTPLTPSPSPPPPNAVMQEESAKSKTSTSPNVNTVNHLSQSNDEASAKKKQSPQSRERPHGDKDRDTEKEKEATTLSNGNEPSLTGRHGPRNSTAGKLKKFYGNNDGKEPVKSSGTPGPRQARSSERSQAARKHEQEQAKEQTSSNSQREGGEGGGFVLVAATTPGDEEEVVEGDDSQNELEINIPGDSQFETSADSQRLLDCLIQPPSHPAPSDPRGPIFQTPPPTQRSKNPPQSSTLPPSRPQTSIFSNMLISRRKTVALADENVDSAVRDDPFHFDSESNSTPADFVLRRKKRKNKDDVMEEEREGEEEEDSNGVSTVHNEGPQVEPSDAKKTNSTPLAPVITSSLSPSSQPHSSTPSHPPPLPPQHPTVSPQTPVSHTCTPSPHHFLPPHLTPTFTPASSLSLSHLPFTSPASRVAQEDISTASRSYRGNRYALRHTHTYRHVVEVKIVSQEVYEGDRVMEGLNTVWQEQSVVSSSPVEKVDVHPYTSTSSPSHTLPTIPVPVLPTTPTPSNLHHQTPPPPTTTAATVAMPVRQVSNCCPPTLSGRRETEKDRDEDGTEEGEEPVVSERNEIQKQTPSTIEQTPQRGRHLRRPTALATPPSSSAAVSGQRLTRTTSGASSATPNRRETPSRKGAVVSGEMCEGSCVIARWRNNSWYAAIVTGSKNGRLNVKFVDGDKSSVSLSHAFLRTQLKRNVLVVAMDDTREGKRGYFSGFTSSSLTDWYLAPLTGGGRVKFLCDQLEVPPTTAQLCIAGKSSTRGVKRVHSEVLTSPASKRRCVEPTEGDEREGEGEEGEDSQPSNSQRSLFEGLSFLLTMRRKEDRHLAATPPSEQFNKEKIASQIRSRMGRVLDSVDHKVTGGSGCLVLSDSYCKTQKYLVGLALGLPCVSYHWILECIEKSELVDHSLHLLPAGQKGGGGGGEVVPWTPRPPGTIMAGVSLTVKGNADFKENWRVIARKAGATVKDTGGPGVVTVSESGRCLQTRARGPRTLVKSDWLAQCLITGVRLDCSSFVWSNSGSSQDYFVN